MFILLGCGESADTDSTTDPIDEQKKDEKITQKTIDGFEYTDYV